MYFPMYFDPTMLILIPGILLTMFAQRQVKSNFSRYMKVPTRKGYSGVEVARRLLDQNDLSHVGIERAKGELGDHYDPGAQTLRLSESVARGSSIAAVSVAAHEVGHAIQHGLGYKPLSFRNLILPAAKFGSSAAWIFLIVGLLIPSMGELMTVGIYLFAAAVLFQVITLPVEFNASSRAMGLLQTEGYLIAEEEKGARAVLNAAALTYVAAMATAVLQLVRMIMIAKRRR